MTLLFQCLRFFSSLHFQPLLIWFHDEAEESRCRGLLAGIVMFVFEVCTEMLSSAKWRRNHATLYRAGGVDIPSFYRLFVGHIWLSRLGFCEAVLILEVEAIGTHLEGLS